MFCQILLCQKDADPYVLPDNSIGYFCLEHARLLDLTDEEDPGSITD